MNYQGMFIGSFYILGSVVAICLATIIIYETVRVVRKGKEEKKR